MTEVVLELIIPMIMADIIDVGVASQDRHYIFLKGAQMILCALAAMALGVGSAHFSAAAGQGFGAEIRRSTRRGSSQGDKGAELRRKGADSLDKRRGSR